MLRRELAKTLALSAFATSLADASARNGNPCSGPCYPPTPAEGVNGMAPADLRHEPGNVLRWGADGTGVRDSTAAIQHAVNVGWASGFYGTPWSGQGGATPVITFPPGRYRVTGTIVVPTGVTLRGVAHPANTVSHTRIIMDSPGAADNRNKPIFRFNRATLNDSALMDSAITSCIQDLEFWYVTMGGTIDQPLREGIPFGNYPDGGCLMFDVDAADTRIVDCVFQHAPAALRIKGVTPAGGKRGDGWAGNRRVGLYIVNCEFDASCTHVYATDSALDLQFKGCQFFGAMHRYEGCTGNVVYQSGRWHGNAYLDAATIGNHFERFTLKGADVEIGSRRFVALDGARLIDVSLNSALGGESQASWIEITDADGGSVVSNAVNNSGCNAAAARDVSAAVAAIKLRGCRNVLVAGNNLTATAAGTYHGFGILSVDSQRPAQANFIDGNAVSAPYARAGNGSEGGFIRVTARDALGVNKARFPDGTLRTVVSAG
jgi:Pectate lyase superfamily protein